VKCEDFPCFTIKHWFGKAEIAEPSEHLVGFCEDCDDGSEDPAAVADRQYHAARDREAVEANRGV
jgi:hypothetical protein